MAGQELLAAQLIRAFADIFADSGLPLQLRPYEVLVTSNRTALIELVPDSLSIHQASPLFPDEGERPDVSTTILRFWLSCSQWCSTCCAQVQVSGCLMNVWEKMSLGLSLRSILHWKAHHLLGHFCGDKHTADRTAWMRGADQGALASGHIACGPLLRQVWPRHAGMPGCAACFRREHGCLLFGLLFPANQGAC